MLKKILTLISIVTIGSALLAQTSKPDVTQYTCVMHPEVVQDHPGKCPKCGMELVPVKKHKKHRTSNTEHPTPKSEAVKQNAQHNMEGRAPSRPTLFLEGAMVGRASRVNDAGYNVA